MKSFYIGMPFKYNETIPAFGVFIGPAFIHHTAYEIEFFAFRRKNPPEMEHVHRLRIVARWVYNYPRDEWNFFFNVLTIPAWRDEPTALAHYNDKGQRWHG